MMTFLNMHTIILFMFVMMLAASIMGFLVIIRGWREVRNIFYFLLVVILLVYGGSVALFDLVSSDVAASVFLHVHYAAGVIIVLDLIYLALTFSSVKKVPIRTYVCLAIPAVLLLLIDVSGQLFTVEPFTTSSFGRNFSYQPIYVLMAFYVILYCGASFVMMLKSYMDSAGVFRQRGWSMAILVVICATIAALSNTLLPLFHLGQFLFVGPYIVSIGLFWFGFLIATNSLWNIKIFATEVFSFLIIVALFGNIFFGGSIESYVVKAIFFILASSAVALLLNSVKNELESAEKVELLMGKVARQHVQLEDLHMRNSKFIIATANQLRDPLSGLRWQCSSLLSGTFGDIPESSREYIGRIFESTKRLLVIVDEFFDLRRIEQKDMEYWFTSFNVKQVIRNVINEETPLSRSMNIDLSFSDDGSKKYTIEGDRGKIMQVISNLVDNAIKYSRDGCVSVDLHKENNTVVIMVKDEGIGFYPNESDLIFEKFRRTDRAKKVDTTGSGLGLYIAKSIVKMHKGSLTAESEGPGRGSTFRLELPFQPKGK